MNYTVHNMLPSPDDARDYNVATQLSHYPGLTVPKKLDYSTDMLPIRNQGRQGACYAFAASSMKEWQEKKDNNLNVYLSPQFFYNHRFNVYDENDNNDGGMYSRDVMKLLQTVGFCRESKFPYNTQTTTNMKKDDIPNDIKEEAKNYIIKNYARVSTIEDLKKSLVVNGPCIITVPTYNTGTRMWKKLSETQKRRGGHALLIVGYNKSGFIIRNSWGYNWGNDGYCTFLYEDWGLQWEVWTTVDLELKYNPPPIGRKFCGCF